MEIKQLFTWIVFCLLSLNLAAQTDTIPKENKERKFHAGIFYSIGLSTLYVPNENGLKASSNIDLYKNWGLMIETKLYKNFWLELNANTILVRDGLMHLTKDTVDVDIKLKDGMENTVLLYLKYKFLQKKKINVMAKLGIGFGTMVSEIYSKNNRTNETVYFRQGRYITNRNYYSFSLGVDVNYQLTKYIIVFNQLTYNMGTNAITDKNLPIRTRYTDTLLYLNNVTPHTFVCSVGIKF